MLIDLIAFEARYHAQRATFYVAAAVFLLFGFVLTANSGHGTEVAINSPYALGFAFSLLSLATVFLLTVFSAQAALRDAEHQMTEIVFSTGVAKTRYLGVGFGGTLATACLVLAAAVVGMFLGVRLPAHDPELVLNFEISSYLRPLLFLALPNLMIVGALLYSVAISTRNTLATYVSGVLAYMVYIATAMLTNSPLMAMATTPDPESLWRAALLDPFGLAAFFQQTHYWTPWERNTNPLSLGGLLLLNRLLWLGLAGLLLAVVHRRFDFRTERRHRRRRSLPENRRDLRSRSSNPRARTLPQPRPAGPSLRGALAALPSTVRLECQQVLRSWPFLVLLLIWAGINAIELGEFLNHGEYGTRVFATAALVLGRISEPLRLVGLVVLVFYSTEVLWRERRIGIDPLVDATPAPSGLFLAAKATTLAFVALILAIVSSGVALLFQLSGGYRPLELGVHLAWIGLQALPLVLVGLLLLVVHQVCPNRYAGLFAGLTVVVTSTLGAFGLLSHPLSRFAALPDVSYSAMRGFHPALAKFGWLSLYWSLLTALLLLLAHGIWRRGAEPGWRQRWEQLRRAWTPRARLAAGILGGGWLLCAGGLLHQIHSANQYWTPKKARLWRADYERSYRHLDRVPQPSLTHMDLEVDLYPEDRRYEIAGRYRLKNLTASAIPAVWFTVTEDAVASNVTLGGRPATAVDERFRTWRFDLDPALEPGQEEDLEYTLAFDRGSVAAGPTPTDIVGNGSFLHSTDHLPRLGYRSARELSDPAERRDQGLPPRNRPTTVEDALDHGVMEELGPRATFEIEISTAADQRAIIPGDLVESWVEQGRRYSRYRMERPVRPFLAYVSAKFAVARRHHHGIEIEAYYHPEHGANVPRFLSAAENALQHFSELFGPYPYDTFRIVEVPAGPTFTGMAAPGTTYYVETAGFLTDLTTSGRTDIVTKRVSHEVAHQWWGLEIEPATGPGASLLVETTARYCELLMLAQEYGEAAATTALTFELERYLTGRAGRTEVPLVQTQREPFLYYAKGALVMMATRDLLGEAAVNRALADLATQSRHGALLTSLDLLEALQQEASPANRDLLQDWWSRVVLYDLGIRSATARPLEDGTFRVSIETTAARTEVSEEGNRPLSFEEEIEVGLYSSFPRTSSSTSDLLRTTKHRLQGETTIHIDSPELPAYVSLDPFLRRIDRNRTDNVMPVEIESMPPD